MDDHLKKKIIQMDDARSSKVRIREPQTGPSSNSRDGENGNEKSVEEFSDDEVDAICLIFVVFEENNLVALICRIYIEP